VSDSGTPPRALAHVRHAGSVAACVASLSVAWLPLASTLAAQDASQGPPAPLASAVRAIVVERVTVVDVERGRLVRDRSVVVRDGRIERIVAGLPATLARDTTLAHVDGRGRYVIPGLWDMHVHAAQPGLGEAFLPLFVPNGVTGIRDMYGTAEATRVVREAVSRGTRPWPRIVGATRLVDGDPPIWPGSRIAMDSLTGRAMVDSTIAAGADFVKVYERLPRAAWAGIAARAREAGIPFVGHVPQAVAVREASDAGQRSIEHLTRFDLACQRDERAARARRDALAADTGRAGALARLALADSLWAAADTARCGGLYDVLRRNGTWQVPTLTVLRAVATLDDTTQLADPRLRYLPRWLWTGWNPARDVRFRTRPPESWPSARRALSAQQAIVRNMLRAGVPMLAGTDVANPYCLPGFSLHDELARLVQAGATPARALRMATLDAARFLQATDSLGTVAEGKVADLVLLDADPLANIAHTTRIQAVIANGRLYRRADLDAQLAAVERAAGGR
jgi:imidazolonepropionase-like amidohydrolase